MSDPNPDDEAQRAADHAQESSVAAARKLAELLARPLEPVGEPGVPQSGRRDPYPPADPAARTDDQSPPAAATPPDPAPQANAESPADPPPATEVTAVEGPSDRPAGRADVPAGVAETDEPPLDPNAARLVKRVRRLMLISSLTTIVAVAAVLGVIGYRVFRSADRPPPAPLLAPQPAAPQAPVEATLTLPKDARIIYTAVAEGLLVVSLNIDGAIEIRTYDLRTLRPAGRMSFTGVP